MQDIDGLLVQPPFHASPRYHMLIGESLGIYVKTLTDSTMMGGASYGVALHCAKLAVEEGLCNERPDRAPARSCAPAHLAARR